MIIVMRFRTNQKDFFCFNPFKTRKMKFSIPSLLSIVAFAVIPGCDTSQKTTDEQPEGPSLYSYEIASIDQKVADCENMECTKVKINYPVFNQGPELHAQLNIAIKQKINESLANYTLEEASPELGMEKLIDTFLQGYQKFTSEFPESTTPWELSIDVIVSHTHPEFVSLSVSTSSYTGGAHPNNHVDYLNLSKDGKVITRLSFFVNDEKKLKSMAEKEFREKYDLDTSEDLSKSGFMFENDQFELTENFGFTKTGMVFYYNSYEIASYAEGPTVLLIPFEELGEIYKSNP